MRYRLHHDDRAAARAAKRGVIGICCSRHTSLDTVGTARPRAPGPCRRTGNVDPAARPSAGFARTGCQG